MGEGLEYQGIGTRFVAQLIDGIILFIVFWIIGFSWFGSIQWQVFGVRAAILSVVNALVAFLYFLVLEGGGGSTIGKKLLKIKVVKEDGQPCGLEASFVRNILRIIDVLPFFYIIGIIFISRSDRKQRLGDKAAHTVVIREGWARPPPSSTVKVDVRMKYCINCGEKIPVEAVFCPKCGGKQ